MSVIIKKIKDFWLRQNICVSDQEKIKNIGLFLGYTIDVRGFEGEGIGRFFLRLVEGLLNNIDDVIITIATIHYNYDAFCQGFREIKLSHNNRLAIEKFYSVEKLNKDVPVDLWIVPYVGMELALQLDKPIILCLHDLNYIHFDEIYKANPTPYDNFTAFVMEMVNKSTRVVFNSNFTRDNEGLKFLKIPKEKTEVIRLAPPTEEYNSIHSFNESSFRDKYGLYDDYITYPTVFRYHKNHDRLIEAFLNFKKSEEGSNSNLKLVLTDHYRHRPKEKEIRELLNKCNDNNARNSVVFLGRLPWNDVPLLYKYAIGTIVPTLFEGGFPWPILESLIMETPVAISRIEVVKEVLTDIEAFITFDPYNIEEIQNAISCLSKNNNKIIEKQKSAIQHMITRTWADVALEYYSLINNIKSF